MIEKDDWRLQGLERYLKGATLVFKPYSKYREGWDHEHEEPPRMAKHEIGCCGAYCRTCRAYKAPCKGCTVGYLTGERDISKARCQVKVCCVTRGLASCADCMVFESCSALAHFHGKPGYKYGKYRQALDFIRAQGYVAFLAVADKWNNACGRYPR